MAEDVLAIDRVQEMTGDLELRLGFEGALDTVAHQMSIVDDDDLAPAQGKGRRGGEAPGATPQHHDVNALNHVLVSTDVTSPEDTRSGEHRCGGIYALRW